MWDGQKARLYNGRRGFLMAIGAIGGSALLAACIPSISSPDSGLPPGESAFENKDSHWDPDFNANSLWNTASDYYVPLEAKNYQLDTKLLPDNDFPGGNLIARIDTKGVGIIQVATGSFEDEFITKYGHFPDDIQGQTYMSARTSEAILYGYCHIAAERNLLAKDLPSKIAKDYIDSFANPNEAKALIVSLKFVPPQVLPYQQNS